jgi:hypothetical protein
MKEAIVDAVGFAGIMLVSYGAWCVYQPAGFITLGSMLIVLSVATALTPRKRGR